LNGQGSGVKVWRWIGLMVAVVWVAGCGRAPEPMEPVRDEQGRVLPQYQVHHALDGRTWVPLKSRQDGDSFIREWILENDSPRQWREMQSVYFSTLKKEPIEVFRSYYKRFKAVAPELMLLALEDHGTDLLCAWRHEGAGPVPAQYEIRRIFKGPDGMYIYAYVVNRPHYTENNFEVWMQIMRGSELRQSRTAGD